VDSQQLKDWGKKNNKFLKLDDGESITATLKSFKPVVKDSFGEEKEVIRYVFITAEGQEKIFDNGSATLANLLADCLGQTIILKREGVREKTRYVIKMANLEESPVGQTATPQDISWEE
jgi:hypothetical protein